MDKLMDIVREWLDGTAKEQACGYGSTGPNVQLKRPNGEVVLLGLREVAEAWLNANKHSIPTLCTGCGKMLPSNDSSCACVIATKTSSPKV